MGSETYPELIESLPDIDLAIEGVGGATFNTRFKAIDVFEEPDRYRKR